MRIYMQESKCGLIVNLDKNTGMPIKQQETYITFVPENAEEYRRILDIIRNYTGKKGK